MNADQAKFLLLACRPEPVDAADPEMAEALTLARQHPDLKEWRDRQFEFHQAMRQTLRAVPVPAGLSQRILRQRRVPPFRPAAPWRQPTLLSAAAVLLLLLGLTSLWLRPLAQDSYATFRSRLVRSVLRQYTMDIVTRDIARVRGFHSSRQAPANYVLPPALAQLPVSGAGVLRWQGQPVSMICLDSPDQGTLFLFVAPQGAVHPAPPARPEFVKVSKLMTAAWTRDGHVYLLAGSGDQDALARHLDSLLH